MTNESRGESTFVRKEPCPECGSKDNLGRYSDGHAHCFTQGCDYWEPATDGKATASYQQPTDDKFVDGEVTPLRKRRISEETCAKWGYRVGEFKGKPVQVANYYKDGKVVGQKVRFADKEFLVRGSLREAGLYGQWLWRDGGRMVVVTEGEIDALSVSQLQGNKWPVVSLPNGAASAGKSLARAVEWLNKFDRIVLLFDNDEAGQKAVEDAVTVLPLGKVRVAQLPLKDANAMLVEGRGGEVIDAIWSAKEHRPDGVVTMADVRDEAMREPETGLPWVFPTLNALTYGRRHGEVYAVGAGTGIGKTDFLTQQIVYDINVLNQKVGVFFLEQQPAETAKRLAGKYGKRTFHIPDAGWTQDELSTAYDALSDSQALFMYDHFGSARWETISNTIRFMRHAEDVRIFYLDHLTALAAAEEDERKALEVIMSEIGGLVKELDITIILVSHLATPEGKPHEEGGRVMIRHFKGSRAIGFWCHYMFGLERNQQSDNEVEQKTTTFRVLKDRYTGRATGKLFYLQYDHETGTLFECEGNPFDVDDPDNEEEEPF